MANAFGPKHWVGFKPQSVAGTAETTVSTFLASSKANMKANHKPIERLATLSTGKRLPPLPGWTDPEGSLTAEVHASQPHPWYWALGAVNTTTPAGTVRLHTITESANGPIRLTVEANKVYQNDKQADAYMNKLTLNFKVGELATLEAEWLAQIHNNDVSLTSTPAFTTDPLTCKVVAISIAGAPDLTVEGGSITWDGQLGQASALVAANGGRPSLTRKEKDPVVSGSFDFLDFPKAYLATMIAGGSFAVVVELTGAVIETTYYKFLRITLPACQYTGGLDEDAAGAMITGKAQFEAFYDAVTSRQILVEAQNTISAINA